MKKKTLLIASIGLTFSLGIGVVVTSGLHTLRLLANKEYSCELPNEMREISDIVDEIYSSASSSKIDNPLAIMLVGFIANSSNKSLFSITSLYEFTLYTV